MRVAQPPSSDSSPQAGFLPSGFEFGNLFALRRELVRSRARPRLSMSPVLLLVLLAATLVLAWGPGNHLEFAHRLYRSRRRTLPEGRAKLLREERSAFFYGNVAADTDDPMNTAVSKVNG